MIEIRDTITKILSTDKESSYAILTFIDTDLHFTDETLPICIQQIIDKFPILKQYIVHKNSHVFLEDDSEFNIKNHYTIVYDKDSNFDSYIDIFLNEPFKTKSKWFVHCIIDKDNNKNRLFFKIDHAYADGYKIIEMLTLYFKNVDTPIKFKRNTRSYIEGLYYLIIGTLTLLIINFKVFINVLFLPQVKSVIHLSKTEYIKCKSLKISIIKEFVKKHGITVNDFLYSLMIKTDNIYTKVTRNIVTVSSINISGGTNCNNMAPIFNTITNTTENNILLKLVHETFNCYKYSFYIPSITFILNNITRILSLNKLNILYDSIVQKCDYVYSNIIGPNFEHLDNIHFLILAKNKEIVFNIISSGENINIICSFKEGIVKDKERFEKCIYEAYDSLITTI